MADDVPSTPLSVLLRVMREKWLSGDHDGAAVLARAAAPYMHSRKTSNSHIDTTVKELHRLTDAELERLMAAHAGGERAPPTDTDIAGSVE